MSKYIPFLLLILILIIAGVGTYFLLFDEEEASPPNETTVNNEREEDTDLSDTLEVDYTINMTNYRYSPSVLTATAGDSLVIRLVAVEGMHDFVIDSLDISSRVITAGGEEIITIEIPEDAANQEIIFYCSVENHRELGMEGIIQVN